MIPRDFITEWRAHAPWASDRQVEQDLVIGTVLDAIRAVLDGWLGPPQRRQSDGRVTLLYRYAACGPRAAGAAGG